MKEERVERLRWNGSGRRDVNKAIETDEIPRCVSPQSANPMKMETVQEIGSEMWREEPNPNTVTERVPG